MTTSPTSRRDLGTGSGRVTGSVGAAALSWTLSWTMQKPAAPPKPRGALRVCSRCGLRHETRRPRHYHGTQGTYCFAVKACCYFHHRCCRRPQRGPGRVRGRLAPAARGDAAQAAFDRKLTHFRNEIGELRQQKIHYRPRVWTADGRPHPAVTQALQCAADIASSQNGQQMSATSLQRRWKHEI